MDAAGSGPVSPRRPNILLLFSDQHNAGVLGCEGHPDVITPNLDRLAAEGVRFRRAYCPDGICMPSRVALMTGLYPRTFGELDNNQHPTSVLERVTPLARLLQQTGYSTVAIGKRHLGKFGSNVDSGWEIARSHMAYESPAENYVAWIESQGCARQLAQDWAAEWGRGPQGSSQFDVQFPKGKLATRVSALPDHLTMEAYTADESICFLKQQKGNPRPFFLWASFYRPHQPYTPQKRYLELYEREVPGWSSAWGEGRLRRGTIRKPVTLDQPIASLPPLLQEYRRKESPSGWACGEASKDPQIWRDYMAAYYALVTEIDVHVGRILDTLAEEGLAQNTIVIYTADHGDFVGSHGLCEKLAQGHCVYEDILRIPLIVRWPGKVRRDIVADDLVENVDLFPTLLAAAGISIPEGDLAPGGVSLLPAIVEGKPIEREYVVAENWSQITVITARYKLGHWIDPVILPQDYRAFGDMLFDRQSDPLETQNIFNDSRAAAASDRLFAYLADWEGRTPATGKTEVLKVKDPTVGQSVRVVPETREGRNVRIQRDGRSAWRCVAGQSTVKYMYFRITDDSLRFGKSPSVEVRVTYYDEGTGKVVLQYDSLNEGQAGRARVATQIKLSGSKTWKTASATISDARFATRCGAGDLRLAMPKDLNLAVSSVDVVKQ